MPTSPATTTSKTAKINKATDTAADAAEGKIADLARRAEAAARRAESVLHDGIETLRNQSRVVVDEAGRRAEETQRAVAEHVREKPISSILAAAGVGLLLGLLIGGSRR